MYHREIEQLLPGIFQRTLRDGSPLRALTLVMQDLHEPSERAVETIDRVLDPRRAPVRFVPFLARWVDLDRLFNPPAGRSPVRERRLPAQIDLARLRELIAAAAELARWRGTRQSLVRFLETATGARGFVVSENLGPDGQPRAFHLDVLAPAEALPQRVLIERIVAAEKPAHLTHSLHFAAPAGN